MPSTSGTLIDRWWLVVVAAAVTIGALTVGGPLLAWILGGVAAVAAGSAWRWWYETRGPGAVVRGLAVQWAELPGATRSGRHVHVHDGMQPLDIRVDRDAMGLLASIYTPIGTRSVSFKVWPRELPHPPVDLRGGPGPPMERAPITESLFAGALAVEASDDREVGAMLDAAERRAILEVYTEARRELGGITYDGQRLGVHFRGALAADPTRAARLARGIWSVWV